MHKYLSVERLSHLNVETELRIVIGGGDPCINVLSAEKSSCLNVKTESSIK